MTSKRKTKQLRWLVTMILLVTAMAMPKMAWAEITPQQPSGGGTSANPYQIGTPEELYWFAGLVNGDASVCTGGVTQNTSANAVLTKDITVNYDVLYSDGTLTDNYSDFETWTPIGKDPKPYTGTFDGQGHTISGLYIKDFNRTQYVGLFGGNSGTIKNVGVVDSYFMGEFHVGGVCGENYGTITGCYNKGAVRGDVDWIGGVCGANYAGGKITGCYNTGKVSGSGNNVGGVCGINGGTITGCYNSGTVSSIQYVGGVCGGNSNGGKITGCYNTGTVSSSGDESFVGGVCGLNEGTITGCYTNNDRVCGYHEGGTETDCGYNTNFTDGTVCSLLNTALQEANASVRFYQGVSYPELIMNVPSLVEDVYQISNKEELYAFALLVNKKVDASANAKLTADIVVNSGLAEGKTMLESLEYDASGNVTNGSSFVAWTPIGNLTLKYTGTFDGQGHTISGMYFNDTSKEMVGLFGYVDSDGKISNVGVLDSYFQFKMRGGGICGHNNGEINNCTNGGTVIGNSTGRGAGGVCGMNYGTVKDCKNTGSVSGTVTGIGGVCGAFYSGSIENCLNEGTVSGTGETTKSAYGGVCGNADGGVIKLSSNTASIRGYNAVGGVCGSNTGATLEDCYNTGAVIGTALISFGGVCGENSSGCIIKNCYNTGAVSGKNSVGGVCGNNSGTITSCYNRGEVNGTGGNVGGVCGINVNGGKITGCYYDSNIYSGNAIGYILGGTDDNVMGKTTAQFNSGEVAYLLNGSSPYGEWGQQIGTNDYPIISSAYKVLRAAQDGQEGTNYWATFSNWNSNAELMASTGEITVYNATVSGGTLILDKRSDNKVASGEGVLLKANCEYVNAMNISDEVSAAATGDNHLVATPSTAETITADDGSKLYRLTYKNSTEKTGLGFYLGGVRNAEGTVISDGTTLKVTPGKAYLKVAKSASGSGAPMQGFVIGEDDNTTGIDVITINGIDTNDSKVDDSVYDLMGRKVSKPAKGIYIKNGKKVIIK